MGGQRKPQELTLLIAVFQNEYLPEDASCDGLQSPDPRSDAAAMHAFLKEGGGEGRWGCFVSVHACR